MPSALHVTLDATDFADDIKRILAESLDELAERYLKTLDDVHHVEAYTTDRGYGRLVLLGETEHAVAHGWGFPGFVGWVKQEVLDG